MNEELIFAEKLETIISNSIKKNGDQPLTLSHFLNIVRYAIKSIERDNEEREIQENSTYYPYD